MSATPDRLSKIARSLNRHQWLPTADEVAFGSAFFQRMKEAEEQGSAFPRGTAWWDRLHTESFATLARVIAMVQDELLPARRERLASSPMVDLAKLYASAAEPLLPHAERLLAAWGDAAPPAPTADEIAREAKRLNVSAEQAERHIRFENASHWEEEGNPHDCGRTFGPPGRT